MKVKRLRKELQRCERLALAGLPMRFTNGSGTIYRIKKGPYIEDELDACWIDLEPVPVQAAPLSQDHLDYLAFEGERPCELNFPADARTWDHGLASWLAAMEHARETL